jgi:LSD1 subclass zinc finger protein
MGLMSACPGSKVLKGPTPESITCSGCGEELEIWTDEMKVRCKKCNAITYKARMPSCIDWCKYAESCVGSELYRQLKLDKTA